MKSKLNPNKFPVVNPFEWLRFAKGWQNDIDFVFACRLAALAKHIGKIINISSGYRSTEEQIVSYKSTGGKLVNGVWTGGNGMAAKPGSSWHEYRLAIDTSDLWLKALEKDAATIDQLTLIQFGVFKPLTKGNKTSIKEDWHIQPVETQWQTDKKLLLPDMYNKVEKGMEGFEVVEIQMRLNHAGYNLVIDGSFGKKTEDAVRDFQNKKGLFVDGKVGENTWKKLYETIT